MHAAIIDRGRGPEIAGSRITVYDVLYETQYGLTPDEIAELFQLDLAQVRVALQYIEEHKEEVLKDYQKIMDRHARGNPPEIQAKIDATHAKYAPLWDELRQRAQAQENGEAVQASRPPQESFQLVEIIETERGPEIAGTCVSVYEVFDYIKKDWNPVAIKVMLRIAWAQFLAAIEYLEEHRDKVLIESQNRCNGDVSDDSREIQSRLAAVSAKLKEMLNRQASQVQEAKDAGNPGGH
jgi:uncharacterized protein (DUF433 family)